MTKIKCNCNMDFITIEHPDGALTIRIDEIDYIAYFGDNNKYNVFLKNFNDLEINKEQYEKLLEDILRNKLNATN